MDSPPQFVVVLFIALVVCLGPVLLTAGILAYSGRWTSWAGPSGYPSTAKHSRFGFMLFWAGLPLMAFDILLALEVLGLVPDATRKLPVAFTVFCMAIVMIHAYFLPKFLRPLLLPRWYRDWEAAQFELEAQAAKHAPSPSPAPPAVPSTHPWTTAPTAPAAAGRTAAPAGHGPNPGRTHPYA